MNAWVAARWAKLTSADVFFGPHRVNRGRKCDQLCWHCVLVPADPKKLKKNGMAPRQLALLEPFEPLELFELWPEPLEPLDPLDPG